MHTTFDLRSGCLWLVCLAGCLPEAPLDRADAGGDAGRPAIATLEAYDWRGRQALPRALPWRPRLVLRAHRALDPEREAVLLLRGRADDSLIEDLERAPLRQEHEPRRVDASIEYAATHVTVVPSVPLEAGEPYLLVVAGWARDTRGERLAEDGQPWPYPLRVDDGARGGARVDLAWPADGASGVPPNLALAAVRFEGEPVDVTQSLGLNTADGTRVAAEIEAACCSALGWPQGGHCFAVRPHRALRPSTPYRLTLDEHVVDAHGAPVGPWSARFDTAASADRAPPEWTALTCALDETAVAAGCLRSDDESLHLRVRASEAVRIRLTSPAGTAVAVAPRGDATLGLHDLAPDAEWRLRLETQDAAGNRRVEMWTARTTRPLPTLSISEVRADALGSEPEQEYVEIRNYGNAPVDLQGLHLADAPDDEGTPIERPIVAHPGSRLLLVADGFDPESAEDANPPPGTPLVRMGSSVVPRGLSNSGEPLFLRDAAHRTISAAPARPRPEAGTCIVRAASSHRDGSPGSFVYDADDGCTPGRADRIP